MVSNQSFDGVSVGIVEDDEVFRSYLRAVVDGTSTMSCAWACAKGAEALKCAAQRQPDVVLVDLYLPGISGLEFIQQARPLLPHTAFLVVTAEGRPHIVFEILEAGASGYLEKPLSPTQVVEAILIVHSGGAALSPRIAKIILEVFQVRGAVGSKLTRREHEVIALLMNGLETARVATALGVSEATARTHVRHILEKLEARSRAEAVAKYLNPKALFDSSGRKVLPVPRGRRLEAAKQALSGSRNPVRR
jgi:DNA-binding NarL/FixJ family response regulator